MASEGDKGGRRRGKERTHLSSSMPPVPDDDVLNGNLEPTKAKAKDRKSRASRRSRPSNLSSSMPEGMMKKFAEYSLQDDVQQESCFDASNVNFEDVYAELQTFNESGSLATPVSSDSFLQIADKLTGLGMEELLKKRWDSQLAGLKAFKREHGDLLVPPNHPTLGSWCRDQRNYYKLVEQRLPGPLTKKRFDKLKDIGFDEFIAWEESRKNAGVETSSETASESLTSSLNASSESIGIDHKIKMKKLKSSLRQLNPDAFSSKEKAEKEKIAAEIQNKRMLTRSFQRGAQRLQIAEILLDEKDSESAGSSDEDIGIDHKIKMMKLKKSVRQLKPDAFSSKDKAEKEKIAAEIQNKRMLSRSFRRGAQRERIAEILHDEKDSESADSSDDDSIDFAGAMPSPRQASAGKTKDNIESWSDLGCVLDGVLKQSVRDA